MEGNNFTALHRISAYLILWMAVLGMPSTTAALNIDGNQQLKYADTLFINQQYLRAAEEYQRFTFFFPDHPEHRAARLKAGESFLLAKDTGSAMDIFKDISSLDPPDEMAIRAFFKMADGYLDLNQPSHAVVQLNNIIALSEDPAIRDRAYYRIGWIHLDYEDWPVAMKTFAKISPGGQHQYGVDGLNTALSNAASIPAKSPALAGVLSIIPGAGQLYCHRYEDALIAFAVNLGLIWAAHDAFDHEQYGLGGLLSFVAVGFYAGNIYGAVNDAHKYNHQQNRQFVDQLKQQQMHLSSLPDGTLALKQGLIFNLTIPF